MSVYKHVDRKSQRVAKRARKSISLDTKMLVISRMESGESRNKICDALHLAPTTVATIMANADKIKKSVQKTTKLRASSTTYSSSATMEEMELLLTVWIDNLNEQKVPLTQGIIATKAKHIFDEIQQKVGGTEQFTASKGWYARFKQRSQIHKISTVHEFPKILKKMIEEDDFAPDLVFNAHETGLYWKRMPSRTYISRKEQSTTGFKMSKDRITLLLSANASGTLKLKPLLVHHSEAVRDLPVIWKCNQNSLVTQQIFTEWYSSHFCPSVLRFCEENNLPRKAFLLLDNAPGVPPNIEEITSELDVKVVYLTPNTTSLHTMDQSVVAAFIANYLQKIFEEIDTSCISLKQYWKKYDILKAVNNINSAWTEVPITCIKGVWHGIWPDNDHDNRHLDQLIKEISGLAQEVGLDNVQPTDIAEWLQSHAQPQTKEDLDELARHLSEEESIQTKDLQDILTIIDNATQQLCDIDSDKERSSALKTGIDTVLAPYIQILQERTKKTKQFHSQ